jgi:uncharacterized protein (TIRG00374 family)
MRKKSGLRFLQIVVTTALLIYVFQKAGLLTLEGWQKLLTTFSNANLYLVLLSVLLLPAMDLASSFKWYLLSRACDFSVSLWRLYAYYIVGRFFSLVLPSSIGGDVVRVHELGRYTGRYADSAAIVFVERFSGLAVLVMLAVVAVGINLRTFDMPWLTVSLAIGSVCVGLVCWVIVDHRPYDFVLKIAGGRIPIVSLVLTKIGKLRGAILVFQEKPEALWIAIFNSLIFYFLAILNVWVSTLAFDNSIKLSTMFVAVPVIMFIMNLPFSIGGIGLTEFAYSFTFGLFGISPSVALSTIVLMRIKTLLAAGLGSLIYPLVSEGMASPQELSKEVKQLRK